MYYCELLQQKNTALKYQAKLAKLSSNKLKSTNRRNNLNKTKLKFKFIKVHICMHEI